MPVTNEQIINALRPVEDPELRRSTVDLGMVRNVSISPDGDGAFRAIAERVAVELRPKKIFNPLLRIL